LLCADALVAATTKASHSAAARMRRLQGFMGDPPDEDARLYSLLREASFRADTVGALEEELEGRDSRTA
jgi:hypothetical protein